MHDHISSNKQHPTQKFHKNLKNFQKPHKPRSNAWNAWRMKDLKIIPQDWSLIRPKTWKEWRLESEESAWRERKYFLSWERSENEIWFRAEDIYRNRSSMDRGVIGICRALNPDRYESVEVLSRICRRQKLLNGSRLCRGSIGQTKTFSMDQKALKKLSRQVPKCSMDRDCVKICQERKSKGLDR